MFRNVIKPDFKDSVRDGFESITSKRPVMIENIDGKLRNLLNYFKGENIDIEDISYNFTNNYIYLNNFYNVYKMLFMRNEVIINSLLQYLFQYSIGKGDKEYILDNSQATRMLNKHDNFIDKLYDLLDTNKTIFDSENPEEIKQDLLEGNLTFSENFREFSFDGRLLNLLHTDVVMMFKKYKTRISEGSNFDNYFKVTETSKILIERYEKSPFLQVIEDEELECISFFANNDNISFLINTLDEMSVYISKLINEMNYQINFYEDTVNGLKKFNESLKENNIEDEEINLLVENYRKYCLEEIRKRERRFNSINNTISKILSDFPNDVDFNSFLTNICFRDTFNEFTYIASYYDESPFVCKAKELRMFCMNSAFNEYTNPKNILLDSMYGGNIKKELLCIRNTYTSFDDENPEGKYVTTPIYYTFNMTLNPFYVHGINVEMNYYDFEDVVVDLLEIIEDYYSKDNWELIRNNVVHSYNNCKKINIPTNILKNLLMDRDEDIQVLLETICGTNFLESTLLASNKASLSIRFEKELLNDLEYQFYYDKTNNKNDIEWLKCICNIERDEIVLPKKYRTIQFIKSKTKIDEEYLIEDIISIGGRILYNEDERLYEFGKQEAFVLSEEEVHKMYYEELRNERKVIPSIIKSFKTLDKVNNCEKENEEEISIGIQPEILSLDKIKKGDLININGVLVLIQ